MNEFEQRAAQVFQRITAGEKDPYRPSDEPVPAPAMDPTLSEHDQGFLTGYRAAQAKDARYGLQLADLVLSMDMATEKGLRARELARKVQEQSSESPAELALRSLASWLGVGGYNAIWVDAEVFESRIREAINEQRNAAPLPPVPGQEGGE